MDKKNIIPSKSQIDNETLLNNKTFKMTTQPNTQKDPKSRMDNKHNNIKCKI